MSALKGKRVLELCESVAGEYCGKLLAHFGAEVIKVESAGAGSPTRYMEPLCGERADGENGGIFAFLNTNKYSISLDLEQASEREYLHSLVCDADVVIDDHYADWLGEVDLLPETVRARYPRVVFCSITPYGDISARPAWDPKGINIFHESGWGYHTPTSADPDRPPLKGPGRFLVDYEAGLEAASCVLASLYWRASSDKGQTVWISQRNVMLSRTDLVLGRILAGDDEASHARTAFDQAGPSAFFPCADGAVYLYVTNQKHWDGLAQLMGEPAWLRRFDRDWLEFGVTESRVRTFREHFAEWVADKKRNDVSDRAQALGVPLVPVNSAKDLYSNKQFRHRRFFRAIEHPVLGEAEYPMLPYILSASPATLERPAPSLGEHNGAGFSPGQTDKTGETYGKREARAAGKGPLAGLRVVEITKVWAGPYAGKLLAFLGAEVIKVESHANLDELRAFGGVDLNSAPYFLSVNQEILSVQANMKTEEGLGYVRELIANSDIVIDNLRPGAMERLGLGYDDLVQIKPDIISVSIKMFGNSGPLGDQTGYAPCFSALGGLSYLVGYEGESPAGINMRYGDSTVGANTVLAVLAAVMHRQRTGEGQFVDVSAVESMAAMVGDTLLQYQLTGEVPEPEGNRHPEMAPHGCYPCQNGEWICIAVSDEQQWRQLCRVLDDPGLAAHPDFGKMSLRLSRVGQLDERIGALTREHVAADLVARLRHAGVAANKSMSSLDLVGDETLWNEGAFRLVSDSVGETRPVLGPGWRMSETAVPVARGAPHLGEHNDYIYGRILSLSPEKIRELIDRKIIY